MCCQTVRIEFIEKIYVKLVSTQPPVKLSKNRKICIFLAEIGLYAFSDKEYNKIQKKYEVNCILYLDELKCLIKIHFFILFVFF